MVRLRLAALFCLLSLIARGRSERESLCKRCAVDRFNVKHKEQCRTLCPGVSSRPVWPPPGHLQGKEEKEEEDRVEVETSSWPAWPPSPDHCARCSRPRYRSANEDVCKDCPESESENPEKANKKVKRKDGKREKKKNKKESKKNKEQKKRNRKNRNEKKKNKTSSWKAKNIGNISRYATKQIEESPSPVVGNEEDLGPLGNWFKSLVIKNTYI